MSLSVKNISYSILSIIMRPPETFKVSGLFRLPPVKKPPRLSPHGDSLGADPYSPCTLGLLLSAHPAIRVNPRNLRTFFIFKQKHLHQGGEGGGYVSRKRRVSIDEMFV
jgi:hypothetical protein